MKEKEVLATYTLELYGPASQTRILVEHLHRLRQLERWLTETEQNLTDLLPDGYWVKIEEADE